MEIIKNIKNKKNKKKFFVIFPILLIVISLVLTPIFSTKNITNAQTTATNQNIANTTNTNTDTGYKYTGNGTIDKILNVANDIGNGILHPLDTLGKGILDVIYTIVGKVCWAISYIIAYIGGVAVALEVWLTGAILNINQGVFNTEIVQVGFSVSLSLANLGFIIGIIIIAIATIIQNQTYGMKQILWKLIFMAILVNFGLVIMGSLFNISNQFTNYFLNCIDPSSGGCNGNEDGLTSSNNFATSLAGAFNPQRDFITHIPGIDTQDNNTSIGSSLGSDLGQLLLPITSMTFVIIAVLLIVITLAAFIIMLLVRYVYIAILAVILPFAWMFWVFPSTKKNFSEWWEKFIQQTIFVPIVLFFLWLAMQTAKGLSSNSMSAQGLAVYTSQSNPTWAIISNFFTNLFSPMIQTFLNESVLLGLMIGGMIAAQKFSIIGAKEVLGAMKNVGNAARGFAMKGVKKGGNRLLNKKFSTPFTGGKKKFSLAGGINKMQTSKVPGVSTLGRELNAQKNKISKGLVDEAAKKANTLDSKTLGEQLQGSMGKEQQLAYLKTLADRGDLDNVKTIGNQSLSDYLDNNPDIIERYGQQDLIKAHDTATLSNSAMRIAQKAINEGEGNDPITINGVRYNSAKEALKTNSDKLIGELKSKDVSKINTKMAFSGKSKETEEVLMDSIAKTNPDLMKDITSKMNSTQKRDVSNRYTNQLKQKINELEVTEKRELDVIDSEILTKKEKIDTMKKKLESDKKIIDDQYEINRSQSEIDKQMRELDGKMKAKIELNKKYNENFEGPSGDYKKALKKFKSNMSNMIFTDESINTTNNTTK